MTSLTFHALISSDLANTLNLLGSFMLIILLFLKELSVASADRRLKKLSKVLDISLPPLLIAFILVVIIKVMGVLG